MIFIFECDYFRNFPLSGRAKIRFSIDFVILKKSKKKANP